MMTALAHKLRSVVYPTEDGRGNRNPDPPECTSANGGGGRESLEGWGKL